MSHIFSIWLGFSGHSLLKDLAQVGNVDTTMTGSYSDDNDMINNNFPSCHRTAWTDKYTTVLFDEQTHGIPVETNQSQTTFAGT